MANLNNNIDNQDEEFEIPDGLEITVIDINVPPVEGMKLPPGNDGDDDLEDTDLLNDGDGDNDDNSDDEDEDGETAKKAKKVKAPKKAKVEKEPEVVMKKIPLIGKNYKARNFTIKIIEKKGAEYICEVIACHPNSGLKVGEQFDAAEIAFASDFYTLERTGEPTL